MLPVWSGGDAAALDQLVPIVYEELCRHARRYLCRDARGHMLKATGRAHEAYLRLVDRRTGERRVTDSADGRGAAASAHAAKLERWQAVKRTFEAVLARELSERAAYLAAACAGDAPLRAEVESLLAAHESADSFLATPAAVLDGGSDARPSVLAQGESVGRYRVLALLGVGGMGQVYLAEDPHLGRKVALKLLPRALSTDPDRLRRFEQEARAASALSHPNVCVVHEVGDAAGGRRYIAMEHVPGESLRQLVARHVAADLRLPLHQVIDIAQQIAAGLEAAHAAGVVHRDVKPENVIVRPDGLVKVLDFGLAKTELPASLEGGRGQSARTEPGMVLGTVQYMSPEQARGLLVDARTDVWSVGAVLYEMLTGRPPFAGETASDVLVAVLGRQPPPLRDLPPPVSPALEHVVHRALQKDRTLRFPHAAELRRALQRAWDEVASDDPRGGVGAFRPREWWAFHPARPGGPSAPAETAPGRAAAPAQQSLVVLPLVNVGTDPELEYFADGMTDELTGALSKVAGLRVASRTSAFAFKNAQHADVRDIGRKLNVAAILEGSVRRGGNQLRVRIQLTSTEDGLTLWSESYQRTLDDVFEVQNDIATATVQALHLALRTRSDVAAPDNAEPLVPRGTANVATYDLYLRARYLARRFTEPDLRQSIRLYEQVLGSDPSYAQAWAGLAEAWINLADFHVSPREAYPQAQAAARRAVTLDPESADGQAMLATARLYYDWELADPERAFGSALALDPYAADTLTHYGLHLAMVGQVDAGMVALRTSRTLDPTASVASTWLVWLLCATGDAERGLALAKEEVEATPENPLLRVALSLALLHSAQPEAALEAAREAALVGPLAAALTARAHAAAGRVEDARMTLERLEEESRTRYVDPVMIALGYAAIPDGEATIRWLEKGFSERSANMLSLKLLREWDAVRSDPRFQALVHRVGLP